MSTKPLDARPGRVPTDAAGRTAVLEVDRTAPPVDDVDEAQVSRRYTPREPVRISGGICGSCEKPMDAFTGECQCSD